jgi:hypothetical protein
MIVHSVCGSVGRAARFVDRRMYRKVWTEGWVSLARGARWGIHAGHASPCAKER